MAIGGITQALPFLYRSFIAELHEYPANQRKKSLIFIGSIVLGLSICALFNIYWCFVIVNVVPQRFDQCNGELSVRLIISSVTCRRRRHVHEEQHVTVLARQGPGHHRHLRQIVPNWLPNTGNFFLCVRRS